MRMCVCVCPGLSTRRIRLPDSPGSLYDGAGGTGPFFHAPNERSSSPLSFFGSKSPATTSTALPGTNHALCHATRSSRRACAIDCSLSIQPRTWSGPHSRFCTCAEAWLPASSSRCRTLPIMRSLTLETSASGNVDCVSISGTSSRHVPMLRASTLHDTSVASNVESVAIVPPTKSIALASATASRLRVPLTSMSAVSSDTPSRAFGSCMRPARTASWKLTTGWRAWWIANTCKPFASRSSSIFGSSTGAGTGGAGGTIRSVRPAHGSAAPAGAAGGLATLASPSPGSVGISVGGGFVPHAAAVVAAAASASGRTSERESRMVSGPSAG